MVAKDMTYANKKLSDFGLIIASFDDSSSDTIDTDSQRSFSSNSLFFGKYQPFVVTAYEDALVITFQIMKDPCNNEELQLSQSEVRQLKKWLNRPTPHKLSFDSEEFKGIYWEGSFNVQEIYLAGVPYGLELEFQSTRPFAIMDDVTYEGSLQTSDVLVINDTSDEEGYIYPNLEIKCLSDGDLEITNSYELRTTKISNCTSGETIIFTPLMQVRSSLSSHKLSDDFNYVFLRIGNTYDETINSITTNIPIEYKLTYTPIAKVVIA